MQLLLLLGVTGKHTRNLSSMRFLVMLTRVPRTKIVLNLKVKELIIIKQNFKNRINITLKKSQLKNNAIKIGTLHF